MARNSRLWSLIVLFAAACSAQAANVYLYIGPTGQTLYARVEETSGNFVAFALVEGTGGAKGKYYATEANIVAAGLDTAGTFVVTIHAGTPSTSAEDPIVGFDDAFAWTGSAVDTSGVTTVSVDNELVVANRTIAVSARADGTTVGTRPIRMRPGEKQTWWIDLSRVVGGKWLDEVTTVTSSDSTKITATAGVNRDLVALHVDATNGVAGSTYTVTCRAFYSATEFIEAKVDVAITSN